MWLRAEWKEAITVKLSVRRSRPGWESELNTTVLWLQGAMVEVPISQSRHTSRFCGTASYILRYFQDAVGPKNLLGLETGQWPLLGPNSMQIGNFSPLRNKGQPQIMLVTSWAIPRLSHLNQSATTWGEKKKKSPPTCNYYSCFFCLKVFRA